MKGVAAMGLAALMAGGCATWPVFGPPARLLRDADGATARGEYERALHGYDVYLARYPDNWAAARVRRSRDAVAAVVATRTELAKLRRELSVREGELARLREELAQARSDLERLKEIDLKHERPR